MPKNSNFLQLKVLAIDIENTTILVSKDEAEPIRIAPGEVEALTDLLNTMGRMQTLLNAGFAMDNKVFTVVANGDNTITLKRTENADEMIKSIKWEELDSIIDDLNEAVKVFIDRAPKQSRNPTSQYQQYNN
jgi:hypothetical protein